MAEIINFPTTEISADQTALGAVPGTPIPETQLVSPKTVNFRGRDVTLKYTLLSMQRLEEQGVSLADMDSEEVSITQIGKMLWAGLCMEFRDATVEEVMASYELSDMTAISEAIAAAMNKTGK